ncbi:PEP-CTERM sorting domain-containing protein [Crenalkalicoccus roseus]|uniref:PEP-CTERM sorting domain-containing protein n=1 Tax=Crenalkalicoccus roseus TaxID=1485588 RepID=UPI00130535A0|nr:PEP-CTERM sorting domain-containing protein [Crenalkalicoccus roseus]
MRHARLLAAAAVLGLSLSWSPAAAAPVLVAIAHILNYGGGACSIIGLGIAVYSLLAPPTGCGTTTLSADKLQVQATETTFSLSLTGNDFDSDSLNVPFSGTARGTFQDGQNTFSADLWAYDFKVSEDAGFINDVLSINGTLTHLYRPHPEDIAAGPPLAFNLIVDADQTSGGTFSTSSNAAGTHPARHTDQMSATLSGTVTSTLFFDDITGYTFVLTGVHNPVQIPEPGALGVLGFGLAALWLGRRLLPRGAGG